jgi:hypothetical protein
MSDNNNFGKMYNQLESRTIAIGAVFAIAGYILKGTDPTTVMYYWYFIYGYIILTLLLTIRAYYRKKNQEKDDAFKRLK